MSTKFMFTPLEMKVLQNFKEICPEMVVEPDKFTVMSTTKSVLARYNFDKPYDFKKFGVYEIADVLNIMKALDNSCTLDVQDKYIDFVGQNEDKVRYFTTAEELIEPVPDLDAKLKNHLVELKVSISADKIDYIKNMANCLKANYIFVETADKRVRITVGKELQASLDNYEIYLNDGISINQLQAPVKIAITDFKIEKGDYELSIHAKEVTSPKKLSKWVNLNGVSYYIFCGVV